MLAVEICVIALTLTIVTAQGKQHYDDIQDLNLQLFFLLLRNCNS